jgi:hypothetical protein
LNHRGHDEDTGVHKALNQFPKGALDSDEIR